MAEKRKKVVAPAIRAKRKPRGKPFPKGNPIGKETRFEPGVSGNPTGKPITKPFTERARWLSEQPLPDTLRIPMNLPEGATYADAAVLGTFRASIKGSSNAFTALRETMEGKLPQAVQLTGGAGEPLAAPSFVIQGVKPPEITPIEQPPSTGDAKPTDAGDKAPS